ncbi:transcription elongation factor GreA [bacterium]|nr:transcription elongation factor GreA [bacterium]
MDRVYLSHDGLARLKRELKRLVEVVRPEVTRSLSTARDHGDLSENAEYDAAKEKLADVDRQIGELQNKLTRVEIIDADSMKSDEIRIHSRAILLNKNNNKKVTYTLVDPLQSDPAKGLISMKSPIGKGLLGKKVGDIAKINVPSGVIDFEVLTIERETEL